MQILLTGFEPFNSSPINPSEQIVKSLADESIPGVRLETAVLPVDSKHGPEAFIQAIFASQPEAILCLGQANRRAVLSIERLAINLLDFRIPDNAGNQVNDQPIIPDGPAAYFTTLPVRLLYDNLKENGIPAELSLSAGSYLCNQITYIMLHYLQSKGLEIPAGFIHLPALPEQVAQMDGSIPSMSLETMIQGIWLTLQLVAGG